MRHLGDALDQVRKPQYARLIGKDRRYIKAQKYTLLSNRETLSVDGHVALKQPLTANRSSTLRPCSRKASSSNADYQR